MVALTATGIGTALGNIGNAVGIGSTISGMFGGGAARSALRQFKYQQALQQQAQDYNTWMMKHRYQLQRKDLENAGINPLYGMATAPMPTVGAGSVGMADDVGEKNGRMQNAINLIGMAQDWSAKKAQIENINQQTKTEEQNTLLKTYEALTKEQEKIEKEISNKYLEATKKKELEKIQQEINESKSRILLNMKEIQVGDSTIALNNQQAKTGKEVMLKTRAEKNEIENRLNIDTPKSEAYGEFLKKHPKFAGTLKGAQDALGVMAALGGGAVAVASKGKVKTGTARKTMERKRRR